ncbi:hypothetical protein Hdeb2414_s0007g00241691 [Helianthus debilis subsp. tardiflorus]
MSKWCRVPVRNKYQISRTDSIFGTDILHFLYRGIYRFLLSNNGPYRYRTVPYRVFSVPVSLPIFRERLVLTSSLWKPIAGIEKDLERTVFKRKCDMHFFHQLCVAFGMHGFQRKGL